MFNSQGQMTVSLVIVVNATEGKQESHLNPMSLAGEYSRTTMRNRQS